MTLRQWCWKRNRNQFAGLTFTFSFYFILPHFLSDQLPSKRTAVKRSRSWARKRLLMCSMRKQVSGAFSFLLIASEPCQKHSAWGFDEHVPQRRQKLRCDACKRQILAIQMFRCRVAGEPIFNPAGGVAAIFSGLVRPAGDEEGTWEAERLHHPKVSKQMIPK